MDLLNLTIAIPVLNEEKNLPGCLDSIGKDFALKIVIIDSGSSDKTVEIAKEYRAEIINFKWNGKFPKKRNWFLRNRKIDTKWILFLDADEYLTADFKKELRGILAKDDKVGYWLSYSVFFMGAKLRGGYPLKKLALFCPEAGEYEYINEENWSELDMEVHEHPVLNGKIGQIKSKIDHMDFNDISRFNKKHFEYACWEAKRFINSLNDENIRSKWTWKQKIKYKLMGCILIGPAFFVGSYFFWGGFRDGVNGLAYAIFKMSYFNLVYCKIRELKVRNTRLALLGNTKIERLEIY